MNYKKKLAMLVALTMLTAGAVSAEARPHGGMDKNNSVVSTVQTNKQEKTDLAVNMNVDGLHPKYSNRVPESWHPMDTVEWPQTDQTSPQPMQRMHVSVEDGGGTLLFSDSPEYVEQDGILYSDVVEGKGRIFYYHLNNTRHNKKIAVVLQNESKSPAVLSIDRKALSAPSDDYLWVGKTAQQQYMQSQENSDVIIFAGKMRVLDNEMINTIVKPGQLVNGIYDFTAEQPVRLSVIMYPANADPIQFMQTAKVLPKDEHRLRGTYEGMNRIVRAEQAYNPRQDGAMFISLADNHHDTYRKGIDATDGSETENYGNYGVMYEIQVPITGEGDVQFMLNPLGGVYAGAMSVCTSQDKNKFLLNTPQNQLYFGAAKYLDYTGDWFQPTDEVEYIYRRSELENLGAYSAGQEIFFEFSPPGASNLPVNLVLMPSTQAMGLAYKWETR